MPRLLAAANPEVGNRHDVDRGAARSRSASTLPSVLSASMTQTCVGAGLLDGRGHGLGQEIAGVVGDYDDVGAHSATSAISRVRPGTGRDHPATRAAARPAAPPCRNPAPNSSGRVALVGKLPDVTARPRGRPAPRTREAESLQGQLVPGARAGARQMVESGSSCRQQSEQSVREIDGVGGRADLVGHHLQYRGCQRCRRRQPGGARPCRP